METIVSTGYSLMVKFKNSSIVQSGNIDCKTMINKHYSFILVIVLLGILSLIVPTFAQNATSTQRDALIVDIQKRAQRDVELDKPHKTLQELHLLFGEKANAQGVAIDKVENWYDKAYEEAKPWWKSQVMAWIVMMVPLFALLAITLNTFIIKSVTWLKNWLYRRLAGYRFLHKIALRRYRQALIKKFLQFKVPFRPDRPLNMREIYVPLKVKGTRDIDQIDAYRAITEHKRLMVLGAPGAGKSMLLRHIMLSYAEGRLTDLPKQPVPILLELNRLNKSDVPIKDKLVGILGLHDFPNAHNFVEMAFKSGTVMLLFDGLDEVNTQERQRVVNKINDLLDKYPHCHAVITCRVAVYHNEFSEKTDQTLEMVDFNEQQIRAFLVPWQKDMPASKSIKQLLHTLHERPRILQLAGNPLLLTIIAYLYTDTTFVLPHSRAEFYTEATKALLEWKREYNRYKTAHKQAVLRHLALFNQDSSGESKQDRRSIDLKTVLAQVKQVLPALNLTNDDIEPLLDEIVERSGLLLVIDGGERYQFAHLTLQEFFAALALRDDANQLLTRFKVDQDAWRETIKIWCGLDHDSSKFIRKIYDIDPIIAFECLADAQEVNSVLANKIVEKFKHHLGREDRIGEGINQAFAAIAADTRRRRGQESFDFLAKTLANTKENEQRRVAAAKILSMTNLPKAAEVLVHYKKIPDVRSALIRMGDLAVPVLEKLAKTRKSIYRV